METDFLPTAEKKQPALRWFYPTPSRLFVVLLAVEGLLLLSERWFPKGWAVLTAIAAVGVTMLLMFLWWLAALCFRWRFQFSLRSLLVLTVVVAVPFSWLAVEMKGARKQREAVGAIRKLGGWIVYDYEQPTIPNPQPPGPEWLRKLLGNDFFANVVLVNLGGMQATDGELEHIKELTQLQDLWLYGGHVTDEGVKHLKGLTQLVLLHLGGTQITDTGIVYLHGLSQLQTLDLTGTKVTAEGVKKLQQALPKCQIVR